MSNLETQRTFALVGTGGCGKTSLAEMLLFDAQAISRMGAIEEGSTSLDYEPEEIRRRGSIQPACATYLWNKNRHFLLDIPGDGNFTGDMEYLLKGVDGVLFVIDAVDGVRPLTKKFWQVVRDDKLPAIIAINKMDRDRADFQMAFDSLTALGIKPVALQLPIRKGEEFTGYVDVLTGKARYFGADGGVSEGEVPAELADDMTLLHDVTVENIAESDENLMEQYLEEGSKALKNTIPEIIKKSTKETMNEDREILKNLFTALGTPKKYIKEHLQNLNWSKADIKDFEEELLTSTARVERALGGDGTDKPTYYSHVDDYRAHLYNYLLDTDNKQFKQLFFGIAGLSAAGYAGKLAGDAIKEVQVKKYNAQTELELQKRLVSTELRNFKAKKDAAINPLVEEFYKQQKEGKSKEELKVIADNILYEIKNGAPFVYS